MKSDYVKALKRIFRIADLDKDGIFSDDELSNFHVLSYIYIYMYNYIFGYIDYSF